MDAELLEFKETILIADDDAVSIEILRGLLSHAGYNVISVSSGEEALQIIQRQTPDIVILDVFMKGINGIETCKNIKKENHLTQLPVIFLTDLDNSELINECFEVGGVDLIQKPFNPVVLLPKIRNYLNLSYLYKTTLSQKEALEEHNKDLKMNYEVAEGVFNKVMHTNVLAQQAFKHIMSPLSIFHGDLLLAAYRPTGELHIMLGDFTGHGISAAIGAIPVADIFYGMTAKGYGLSEIVNEVNSKLNRIMPCGLFLAACFIEYYDESMTINVWNGGIPLLMIHNYKNNATPRHFISKNLPLGIMPTCDTTNTVDVATIVPGDCLYMASDGITEARNTVGKTYGSTGFEEFITTYDGSDLVVDIALDICKFTREKTINDDLTFLGVTFDLLEKPVEAKEVLNYPEPVNNSAWHITYCFGPGLLRETDPLPIIIQSIMDYQKLYRFRQSIFIIIKELFTNALDHGLLELDSSIKNTAEGFADYFKLRKQRLSSLTTGVITVEISHKPSKEGGNLYIEIRDSGRGFDTSSVLIKTPETTFYHGRGIILVKNICSSLTYNSRGNEAIAQYQWSISKLART